MQYKRISADCHLDLPWLPAELFVAEAKRELRDRMPFVEDGPDGPHWITKAGVEMGLVGGTGNVGHRPQWVGRGLDPHEARPARADRPAQPGLHAGVVRDHDSGRGVVELEYEAHPAAQQINNLL